MKRYLQYFLLLLSVFGGIVSCKKDDDAMKQTHAKMLQHAISGVNGPTSGNVNEELVFNVLWANTDSTRKFDHFQDSVFHNTRVIRLFSSTTGGGDSTLIDKDNKTVLYKFKSAKPGIFYLKFYTPDNTDKSAIIDTLVIGNN